MVSIVLAIICSACIGSAQLGGIKGLQMIDHIFSMEAKIVEFVISNYPSSGVFACDIASAFPSLSRKYLFWVLRAMGIPRKLYRIIRNLHLASYAFVCVRNRLFMKIRMAAGVKQGDPSAMQLFILAYDPLIRFIAVSLSPVEHYLFAYCDDLAIACRNIASAWGIIIKCFLIIERISALALNNDKTQFLCTSHSTRAQDQLDICALDQFVSASQFVSAIKYLGIFLGFEALRINWSMVSSDFLSTARFIGTLDCGLLTKISLYNMLAISKLSYVAAFLPPNRDILRIESRALQLLLRGPWNAIPAGVLKHACSLGLPTQARDLTLLSRSARIRVAASTSRSVISTYDRCANLFDMKGDASNELVLSHIDKHFLYDSCLHHVVFQYRRYLQEFGVPASERISQADAYKMLASRIPSFDFHKLFLARMGRHFDKDLITRCSPHVLRVYKQSNGVLGFAPLLSHLRAVTNHWCTYSRFGVKTRQCLFGCGFCSDRVSHTVRCEKFWEIFCGILGFPSPGFDLAAIFLFDSEWIAHDIDKCNGVLLGLHTCFLCFHACKHGQTLNRRLVLHKLHGFTRSHANAIKFMRRTRRKLRLS